MKSVAFRRPAEGKDAPPGSQETQSRWGGFPGGSSAMMRNVGLRTQLKKERERGSERERETGVSKGLFFRCILQACIHFRKKKRKKTKKKRRRIYFITPVSVT